MTGKLRLSSTDPKSLSRIQGGLKRDVNKIITQCFSNARHQSGKDADDSQAYPTAEIEGPSRPKTVRDLVCGRNREALHPGP